MDNPELREESSRRSKQKYIDNPKIKEDISKTLKQRYIDNPELKEEISNREKQRYIDNPELREQMSKIHKQRFIDYGGWEGYLKLQSTRSKAIQLLNNLIHMIIKREGRTNNSYRVYNKYMNIINNHTYPDEVQQGATV